jgi:hypothetical protein
MAEQDTGSASPQSWGDVLLNGVSGYIDSQIAKNYQVSDPVYNTAGGRGGTGQLTQGAIINVGNPVIWIAVAVVVGFLLLRKA